MKRWLARIYYQTESGADLVKHEIDELDELASIIEHGPDWDAIISIEIAKVRCPPTVERAAALRGYDLMNLD
jgi:hypothetical protein